LAGAELQHVAGVGRLDLIGSAAAGGAENGLTGGQAIIMRCPIVVHRTGFKPSKCTRIEGLGEPGRGILVADHVGAEARHRYWVRNRIELQ
jgi:hypothetical protein